MLTKDLFVFWLILASASCEYRDVLSNHRCDPGSEVFACVLEEFHYVPGENNSRLIEPEREKTRKIIIYADDNPLTSYRTNITTYDAGLHEALQRPRAVEITHSKLNTIEIPADMEYAGFRRNHISNVIVPAGSTSALRFLNLEHNAFRDISNLSSLVSLETINLAGNHMSSVPENVFQRMTNLSCLSLAMNRIVMVSLAAFPSRLEMLYLHGNMMHKLDLKGAHLPNLAILALSFNHLEELEPTVLLAAAPHLAEIALTRSLSVREQLSNISGTLEATGITIMNDFPSSSHSLEDEEYDDEEDEDDDYQTHLVLIWEHIFSALLVVVNATVIVWAVVIYYKSRRQNQAGRVLSGIGSDIVSVQ